MQEFLFNEQPVEKTLNTFLKQDFQPCAKPEIIDVQNSVSRILYEDVLVKYDLPQVDKALIDGYAVKTSAIAEADRETPVFLKLVGEANVNDKHDFEIAENQTVKVEKGAKIPKNADAVISPEDTLTDGKTVKFFVSALSGCEIKKQGEDVKAGDVFILKQRKIRPQDIGGIIGVGHKQVKVFKKPEITIIPTGSELVSIDEEPDETQMIASNSYVLKASVEQLGGAAKISKIVHDSLSQVKKAIMKAVTTSDMVIISGGCSVGTKDYTLKALQEIPNVKIIAHSIAMRPGGHVLLAIIDGKPVIGLPGHSVSNFTSFQVFVKPVLRKLCGDPRSFWQVSQETPTINATLTKNIQSPEGKEDYVRVRVKELENGKITAYPFTGRSSFLSTLVKSHGMIKIPTDCTALYEGDVVTVYLF